MVTSLNLFTCPGSNRGRHILLANHDVHIRRRIIKSTIHIDLQRRVRDCGEGITFQPGQGNLVADGFRVENERMGARGLEGGVHRDGLDVLGNGLALPGCESWMATLLWRLSVGKIANGDDYFSCSVALASLL